MTKLRLAIVGCNNMGTKHLNVLREHFVDEVEVVGILNSTPESSKHKGAELGVPCFENIQDITRDKVDAVIVSTPGITHAEVGVPLLEQGIPMLMEKPMGTTLSECDALITAAEKSKTLLMVGHTENYNPAVVKLKQELISPLKYINGIRTSRQATNSTGITAVQELMIHDIAIIYSLLGDDLESINIHKHPALSWENHAIVELRYKNGAYVQQEAMRGDPDTKRNMELEDESGNKFRIDFLERRLEKNGQLIIEGGDTMVEELRNFIQTVKGNEKPLVTGQEAKDILSLCLKLEDKIPSCS